MKTFLASLVRHPVCLPFVGFTLACIWPGVAFLANNASEFAGMDGSAVLVVVLLCAVLWLTGICLAVVPALLSIRWSVARAFSVGTIAVFVLFSHQAIRSWLLEALSVSGIPARKIYLLILAGLLALAWRLSRREPARLAFVMAMAFMIVPPVGEFARFATATLGSSVPAGALPADERGSIRALSNQNVYYVILDGYAGRPALNKYLDYDIDSFLAQMHDLGYSYIDSARTNYVTTHVSLMATLEMDYVIDEKSPRYADRRTFFPYEFQFGRPPRIVRQLLPAGYDVFHVGNQWAPCRPRPEVNCLITSDYWFYEYVAGVFLAPTKVPLALLGLAQDGPAGALTSLSHAIGDLTRRKRPFFAFVHELSPHPPYRRADCSEPRGEALSFQRGEVGREKYKNSIRCVNLKVQALAKRIEALDPDAIVVFQADHGSDFEVDWKRPLAEWSDAAIDERSSIFNLVHFPDSCRQWLRPDLSQINTMRLVFGCLERHPPDYLKEHTYITGYEGNPDFGIARDVTDRLIGLDEGVNSVHGKH